MFRLHLIQFALLLQQWGMRSNATLSTPQSKNTSSIPLVFVAESQVDLLWLMLYFCANFSQAWHVQQVCFHPKAKASKGRIYRVRNWLLKTGLLSPEDYPNPWATFLPSVNHPNTTAGPLSKRLEYIAAFLSSPLVASFSGTSPPTPVGTSSSPARSLTINWRDASFLQTASTNPDQSLNSNVVYVVTLPEELSLDKTWLIQPLCGKKTYAPTSLLYLSTLFLTLRWPSFSLPPSSSLPLALECFAFERRTPVFSLRNRDHLGFVDILVMWNSALLQKKAWKAALPLLAGREAHLSSSLFPTEKHTVAFVDSLQDVAMHTGLRFHIWKESPDVNFGAQKTWFVKAAQAARLTWVAET